MKCDVVKIHTYPKTTFECPRYQVIKIEICFVWQKLRISNVCFKVIDCKLL